MSTERETRTIEGGCHCGAIRYSFTLPDPEGRIPVRACGCTFCLKHGGVYTSHPEGSIEIIIGKAEDVERYRFGHETADFHICRNCGVVPVVTSEIGGKLHAVVNVNTFEDVSPDEFDRTAADFDGEEVDARLERRKHNWISDVTFT